MAQLVKQEGNTVEFQVVVPQKEVRSAFDRVYKDIAKQVKVPGFRPGKAPRSVLNKRVGDEFVQDEVRRIVISYSLQNAVRELKLSVITDSFVITPQALSESSDFSYGVQGETYPEVHLPDWKAFHLEAKAPEITEDVVEKTIQDLRERNAVFESVSRPAEASDQLSVLELGEEESNPYPVYLDTAQEFVRNALIGQTVETEVNITLPETTHGDHTHPSETLTVKILDIKKKTLPELDETFAKGFNFETVADLKAAVEKELQGRAQAEGQANRRDEFVERLTEGLQGDIPTTLIRQRRESMFEEIKRDLENQGVPFAEYETFMREQGKYDDFLADLEKNAIQRVKRDLALEKLADNLGVQLTQSEFDQALANLAASSRVSVAEASRQLGINGLSGFQATVLRDKALAQALLIVNAGEQLSAIAEIPTGNEEKVEVSSESL